MSTKEKNAKIKKETSKLIEKVPQKTIAESLSSVAACDCLTSGKSRFESQLYQDAYKVAARYLDNQLSKYSDFEWLKCDPKTISFDDITFRYKDIVVSVLFKIFYNGKLVLWEPDVEMRWVQVSEKNDLLPLIVPIKITETDEQYEVQIGMRGLDFWDWMTTDTINPIELASNKHTKMSQYELLNAAVKEVLSVLEKKDYIIDTWNDDPGLSDSTCRIYFIDPKDGDLSWLAIRYGINQDINNIQKPNLNKANYFMASMNGYFTPVVFECENNIPYRGDKLKVRLLSKQPIKMYDGHTKTIL